MNYLLVMPRFVDKVGEWYFFPLGIPYVSASMKQAGFRVETLNLNNESGDVFDIIADIIEEKDIQVVLTGGLSVQYDSIRNVLIAAKSKKADIVTVVGGGIITSTPIAGMKALEYADYGIVGEGEITVCELCHKLEARESVEHIAGIVYHKLTGDFINNGRRKEIDNLDEIPFPDYDGFGYADTLNLIPSQATLDEGHTMIMLGSRSCPFQCTFCFHSSGSKYRQRSLDNFFAELAVLKQKYDIHHIFIADELFSYDVERVREFCHRIKPLGIKWYACFRVSDMTEEMAAILKEGNCTTVAFGLESADNRVLKSMRKHTTVEQIERALDIVYKNKIAIQGNFIFGDIAETLATAKNTLRWWKAHPQYGIILNFIVTYPGTYLYQYAVEHGIIKDEVAFIKEGCPAVNVSRLSDEEMAWLSNQILSLPLKLMKEPINVADETLDKLHHTISFSGDCIHCGKRNHWKDIRLFLRNQLSCRFCGGKHKIPLSDNLISSIEGNINKLLKSGKLCAFWGLPDYFIDFLERTNLMCSDDIYLVDMSALKQGSLVCNKRVHSPYIIRSKKIDIVIVGAVGYYAMIYDQIQSEYPGVYCMSILDLLNDRREGFFYGKMEG